MNEYLVTHYDSGVRCRELGSSAWAVADRLTDGVIAYHPATDDTYEAAETDTLHIVRYDPTNPTHHEIRTVTS